MIVRFREQRSNGGRSFEAQGGAPQNESASE
jgi:hypothetical protein